VAKKTFEIKYSNSFKSDLLSIHEYGTETFGIKYANLFIEEIILEAEKLSLLYLIHPECRHLITKSKKYRNIILGAYLVIYRIQPERIEVLRVFHGSKSPTSIRNSRSVKI
jgi:addiction module RelE/StbE family toxin